ncbi:hypothetical protein D0864_13386 [Hortaea werneckii]|uniref:DUF7704 domain-containing protein n=1 Tax=Hortaea werneckii TaxID=91943 RepID=A0A3M7D286_HORWE|nr:hypothetical protein KC323_g6831 [Hortaea werneckii]KAI6861517.1 hypothetical protein KC338_g6594 [Hortaea werneckii]KAI7350757.1 hypothetical protein KC320_g5353 [Hortaea werneckii]RMY58360.1 hypothetical protein D0864_13386 [Hortaea werneckii]RMY90408.1 hypothetical protein D0862_09970 [Hortaea werneckii]
MASKAVTPKASASIPQALRVLLLYVEPLFTVGGILLLMLKPEAYTKDTTRSSMTIIDPKSIFVYTQLAGGWAHIAFSEAVILRLVDDVKVWKLICIGVLLSDALYCHSMAQAVGGWATWIEIGEWSPQEWVATAMTWPFVLTRLAIVSGFAVKRDSGLKRA